MWNETVVPYCSRKFQYVNNVEIRKRAIRGVLSDRAIWYHGADGFYNIDYVDRARQAVYDLTIYRLDDQFRLRSVVQRAARGVDRQALGSASARSSTSSTAMVSHARPLPPDEPVDLRKRSTTSSRCSASRRS